jgi:hypothetical protein
VILYEIDQRARAPVEGCGLCRCNQIGRVRLAAKNFFGPVLPIAKIAPPAAKFLMDGRFFRHGGFAAANRIRPRRNFPCFTVRDSRPVRFCLVLRQPS